MTLNSDIILKTWLQTLRFSIEYYEDTFDSKNNRQRENNRSAKNMIVGGETNEDSDDEHYVNLWECSASDKSASKLQDSLESVGNTSEVSNFEGDNSSASLNTHSVTDLSVGSYFLGDTQSSSVSFEDTTDLDEEIVERKPKKPKITPRISKDSTREEVVYENLPLRTQSLPLSFKHNQQQNAFLQPDNEGDSENTAIYENLPLRPQKLTNFSITPQEYPEEIPCKNSLIYENLPCRADTHDSVSDESDFEEAVCSTIQYLEDVLDSVDTFSEDSDIEECETTSTDNPTGNFESDISSLNSKIEEENLAFIQNIDEEKFTESSSSFEEYVCNEYLKSSNYSGIKSEPQNFNQRFAKDSRISAFLEESEPVLPHEVKSIPIPKRKVAVFDPRIRCSVPINLREHKNTLNIRRPQSLQSSALKTADIGDFDSFTHCVNKISVDIDNFKPQNPECTETDTKSSNIFEEPAEVKSIAPPKIVIEEPVSQHLEGESKWIKDNIDDCDIIEEQIEDSRSGNLNISFANESRVSILFEEGLVQELDIFEIAPEKIFFEGQPFFEGLNGDVLMWMAELMENYCGEKVDIMEDKELLKSINQFPKERIERPENKFPLDDENVEVRRKPSIHRNRISKTTDFDLGRRKQDSPINPKNFDIRGIVKFQLPNNTIITKLNQEYVAYENENFYRINEKTKSKVLLGKNILLKSARYLNSRSKESKEVELKDSQNLSYILYFDSIKYAKQFMENEKIQVYVSDNKITIKKTLLRFLGKRSSREILEKKGIYKNEPIFGNTLRDIYIKGAANSGSPVPMFIYRVIELIERSENIKSLGLYRTSGNLATIQKIRFEVDNGRLDILDQFSKDPDVLTGSLKLFFRELKEPLISCEVCEKLMDFTKLDPKKMSSKEHQKIKSTLIKNLYEANLETFFVVMRHLLEVVKYKEHNKMDTYNLAVCWGPSMIFSVHGGNANPTIELSRDIVTQSHDASRLVDFLLGYYQLYPSELDALSKRPESITEKILALRRQESRDSVESSDSSKSQKKSSSNLTLSIDEITKKLIEIIEPNLSSEGLYRKSGSPDKTNKIMKKLNKKKINELDKYKADVHDMTDALKKYLKEQDGLVTKETVELVLKATCDNSQNYLEPITRRKVTSLIEETPKKDTLIFLLRHLAKVVDHQTRHKVPKNDVFNIWTDVLNYQRKCQVSNEEFAKFLTVSVEVLNDNLPDVVRSSFNNNGSSPNKNVFMGEVVKQIKHQQERDRNSRYDNVDCDVTGEASVLDDKTEQTKL